MNQTTTKEITSYMKVVLIAKWNRNSDKIELPKFPLDLLEECNFVVKLLVSQGL